MFAWLPLALVFVCMSVAVAATLAAWKVRRAAPRTISLALSLLACAAVSMSAIDLSIPLPETLCVRTLGPREGKLQETIEQELGRWRWWWRPCGRLKIDVTLKDLEKPIDFARLAALASEAGVAVDVTPGATVPWPGEQLALARMDETHGVFGIQAPVPASMTDCVKPALARSPDTPLTCRLDGDSNDADTRQGAAANPSLDALLEGTEGGDFRGFHHIECTPKDATSDRRSSAYVRVSQSGVMVTSKSDGFTIDLDDPKTSSFGLYLSSKRPVLETAPELGHAAMLVLDQPEKPETCELAKRLLTRGGTVVIAMPTDEFMAACDWLPVASKKTRNGKPIHFDRRPRLTYVLDNFAEGLEFSPSIVLDGQQTYQAKQPYQARNIATLKNSVQLQTDEARRICKALRGASGECDSTVNQPNPGNEQFFNLINVERTLDASTCRPRNIDCERIELSSPANAASAILAIRENSSVYYENEQLFLFTHDQRPLALSSLTPLLETGPRVHVALVRDPYGFSLSKLIGRQSRSAAPGTGSLVIAPEKRILPDIFPPSGEPIDQFQRSLHLDTPAIDGAQAGSDHRTNLTGRFNLYHPLPTGEAPVRLGWYDLKLAAHLDQVPPFQLAHTTSEESGLTERLLAAGAIVDRGHLLFLSYSPFEDKHGYTKGWDHAPRTADVLDGTRAITELYKQTEQFLSRIVGNILSVDLQPDGAIWVTIVAPANPDQQIREVIPFVGANTTIEAPLIEMDPNGGWLTYALPARDLGQKLSSCEPLIGAGMGQDERVYACPPRVDGSAAAALNAANNLQLLARYTGGRSDPGAPATGDFVHTRTVGICTLSIIFLIAWGRRAVRRISGRAARRKLRVLERASQRRYDPPDAVVAAAGDWDGRSSTWPRTGSFGGYRSLEAGDRPSAIVLQDLVLAAQGGPKLLPRVATRIEESAPSVCLLVHLGDSMRAGRTSSDGKALCASRVASHIAAAAWKIRAEVGVLAAGVRGDTEIIAPTVFSPGHEIIESNLRERLRQSATEPRTPWPEELPECGAVVYISDFLTEDEHALNAWVNRLEAAGIRVAGVMIYSPVEFTMIEGGRLAGSGTWVDRADWTPDDVFAAFCRRRDEIERIFDIATTGGMIAVATQFGQDDIEISLEGGRLLQILR